MRVVVWGCRPYCWCLSCEVSENELNKKGYEAHFGALAITTHVLPSPFLAPYTPRALSLARVVVRGCRPCWRHWFRCAAAGVGVGVSGGVCTCIAAGVGVVACASAGLLTLTIKRKKERTNERKEEKVYHVNAEKKTKQTNKQSLSRGPYPLEIEPLPLDMSRYQLQ